MASVTVVYILPVGRFGSEHWDFGLRFLSTYLTYPAGYKHSLIVVSNGGPPSVEAQCLFESTPHFTGFIVRPGGEGKDIGSYISVSKQCRSDVMLCCGGTLYFSREGWLKRIMEVHAEHPTALLGACGSMVARPHIRTTGFLVHPKMLAKYPDPVVTDADRYRFEHGEGCITDLYKSHGRKVFSVGWGGVYSEPQWHNVAGIYHAPGGHADLILHDKVSDIVKH